ncbi:MAG TPA: hypothetical protein VIY72_01110 [Acidimicrobiales bacterium]
MSAASVERLLPEGFEELEPWVATWAHPTRAERYAVRLATPIDEIGAFYDAVAARAEEAIDVLSRRPLAELDEAEERLLQLLYSMILVSYAVNVFKQPRIPDSGSAFFDTVVEPAI